MSALGLPALEAERDQQNLGRSSSAAVPEICVIPLLHAPCKPFTFCAVLHLSGVSNIKLGIWIGPESYLRDLLQALTVGTNRNRSFWKFCDSCREARNTWDFHSGRLGLNELDFQVLFFDYPLESVEQVREQLYLV